MNVGCVQLLARRRDGPGGGRRCELAAGAGVLQVPGEQAVRRGLHSGGHEWGHQEKAQDHPQ